MIKRWGFYLYNKNRFAFLPYIMYAYYPYQGESSIGALKRQVQFGWLVFAGYWNQKHGYNTKTID